MAVITTDQHTRAEILPGVAVVSRDFKDTTIVAGFEVEDVEERQSYLSRVIRNRQALLHVQQGKLCVFISFSRVLGMEGHRSALRRSGDGSETAFYLPLHQRVVDIFE